MATVLNPGDHITLIATDPWEFVSIVGDAPLSGKIVAVDKFGRAVVIELDKPLTLTGKQASCFLAKPRRLNATFGDDGQQHAFCGLTSVLPEHARSGIPPSLGELSGDIMFLGDVSWEIDPEQRNLECLKTNRVKKTRDKRGKIG